MGNDVKVFKQDLIEVCRQQLETLCRKGREQMDSLRAALESEEKSSAGDKHETGRAMIQLEMERTAARLAQQGDQLQLFERLVAGMAPAYDRVAPGSLVVTGNGYYFMAVSLGPVVVGEQTVNVLSSVSPVGKALTGRAVGDIPEFNGTPMHITAIV